VPEDENNVTANDASNR